MKQQLARRSLRYRAVGHADAPDAEWIALLRGSRRWPKLLWEIAANTDVSPEKKLWASVLIDAIKALRGRHTDGLHCVNKPELIRLETRRWVKRSDRDNPGAFEWVCMTLDIDVEIVREDLLTISEARGR